MDDLTGILAFVCAVEARSITKAARQLGISPSGVSKAISRIENAFKVRLLQHSSRSVTLTDEGSVFYERCRRILLDLEEAEQALSQARDVPRGLLRVSLPLALGRRPIARLLPEFVRRHPEIAIEAHQRSDGGFDRRGLRRRRSPRLTAGFPAGRASVDGGGKLVTCAAPAYLKRHGTPKAPEDLRALQIERQPLAVHPGVDHLPGQPPRRVEIRVGEGLRIDAAGAKRVLPDPELEVLVPAVEARAVAPR